MYSVNRLYFKYLAIARTQSAQAFFFDLLVLSGNKLNTAFSINLILFSSSFFLPDLPFTLDSNLFVLHNWQQNYDDKKTELAAL